MFIYIQYSGVWDQITGSATLSASVYKDAVVDRNAAGQTRPPPHPCVCVCCCVAVWPWASSTTRRKTRMVSSTWPTAEKTPLVLEPLVPNVINTLLQQANRHTQDTHSRDTHALMFYQVFFFPAWRKNWRISQGSRMSRSKTTSANTLNGDSESRFRQSSSPKVTGLFLFSWWSQSHPGKAWLSLRQSAFACVSTHHLFLPFPRLILDTQWWKCELHK